MSYLQEERRNIGGIFDDDTNGSIYFDILFDDGSVLACMAGDSKGSHVGQVNDHVWGNDPVCNGYAHLRLYSPNTYDRSYISVLEACAYEILDGKIH